MNTDLPPRPYVILVFALMGISLISFVAMCFITLSLKASVLVGAGVFLSSLVAQAIWDLGRLRQRNERARQD